jgi:phosphoglycerate dehydrogenase-like enzyme
VVALLPRELEPIDAPGVHFYDAVASIGDVESVEFFVPPYMGPADELVVLSRMPRLKVVQLLTAGYENALRYVPAGVTLCNAGGVHDASTAELAVGLMIASLRGIDAFARAMPSGTWLYGRREALADKRVLVVGAGGVGDAIRRRLEPFETDVVMVGRTERPGVHAAGDLPALLPGADIVVLAVPLTEATHRLVGTQFLARMRDGALLVNVSRGSVVDTDALTQQVAAGRIRVALDVTDPEPLPPDHPLWALPGVLISPHVGGNTSAFLPRARDLVAQQILRYASGEPLASVVSG